MQPGSQRAGFEREISKKKDCITSYPEAFKGLRAILPWPHNRIQQCGGSG